MSHKKIQDELKELSDQDVNCQVNFYYIETDKDPYHVSRRQQQRAISDVMIKIALGYGLKLRIHGAVTYTLTDRSLMNTPYQDYIEELRGLRVVVYVDYEGQLGISTTYWFFDIKKKVLIDKSYLRGRPRQQRSSIAA